MRGLNTRAGEVGEGTNIPSSNPEAGGQREVVDGPDRKVFSDPNEFPKAQAQQDIEKELSISFRRIDARCLLSYTKILQEEFELKKPAVHYVVQRAS